MPYDSLWNHLCGWIRCLACPLVRECQSAAGNVAQVSGRVTDGSGAAVPGVAIKLLETQRNIAHTATTDEQGLYVLPGLPVGPYQLEVKKEGFKSYSQTGIVLQEIGRASCRERV